MNEGDEQTVIVAMHKRQQVTDMERSIVEDLLY
jgi:hypothetical protein